MRELDIYKNIEAQRAKEDQKAAKFQNFLKQQNASFKNPIESVKAKELAYDATLSGKQIERYKAYGEDTFKEVGFNPFLDNESRFNTATSWGDDFARATSQMGKLAWLGVKSAAGSSLEDAKKFEEAMAIGSSSKDGFGAQFTNTWLSSGYTLGIMAEIYAEEVAMAGIVALTGGGASGVAAARTAANAIRLGKAADRTSDILRALKKAETAKDYYKSVKMAGSKVGGAAANILTPDTYKFLKNFDKIKDLPSAAKTATGFGSFYRDLRAVAHTNSEAQLEGHMSYLEVKDSLINEFRQDNAGRFPDEAELQKIEGAAVKSKARTYASNLPLIYLTDKITLGKTFRGFKPIAPTTAAAGEFFNIIKKQGVKVGSKEAFEIAGKGLKGTAKAIAANPLRYGASGLLKYTKANFAEGIQELGQEIVGHASTTKAIADYSKEVDAPYFNYLLDATKHFASAEGAHIFSSGFIMGGIVQGPQRLAGAVINPIQEQVKKRTEGEAYKNKSERKEAEQASMQEKVDALNDMFENPLDYFSPRRRNMHDVAKRTKDADQAEKEGDIKANKDARDDIFNMNILTALQTNTYDEILNEFEELEGLDNAILKEMFGEPTDGDAKIKTSVTKAIARAKKIKRNYDVFSERFKNPYPKPVDNTAEDFEEKAFAYSAFEAAKMDVITSAVATERTLDRMKDIQNEIAADKDLNELGYIKTNALLDLTTASEELRILKEEIDSYDPEGPKKELNAKTKEYEALEDYRDSFNVMSQLLGSTDSAELSKEDVKELNKVKKDLSKSITKYLSAVSGKSQKDIKVNADSLTNKLLDHHVLNQDNKNLSTNLNMLLDPANFLKYFNRIAQEQKVAHENKEEHIKETLEKDLEAASNHDLVKQLLKKDAFVDKDELIKLVQEGVMPTKFYDVNTAEEITGDRKKEIDTFIANKGEAVEESTTEEEVIEEVTPEFTRDAPIKDLPENIVTQLRQQYIFFQNRIPGIEHDENLVIPKLPEWFKSTEEIESINAINSILDQLNSTTTPEVKVEEPVVTSPKAQKNIAKVVNETSIDKLNDLQSTMIDLLINNPSDQEVVQEANETLEAIEVRKEQLSSPEVEVEKNNIAKDDLVKLKNSKFTDGVVTNIKGDKTTIQSLDGNEKVTIDNNDLNSKVDMIVKPEQGEIAPQEVTAEEQEVVKASKASVEEFSNDAHSIAKKLEAMDKIATKKLNEDFENDLGCK